MQLRILVELRKGSACRKKIYPGINVIVNKGIVSLRSTWTVKWKKVDVRHTIHNMLVLLLQDSMTKREGKMTALKNTPLLDD